MKPLPVLAGIATLLTCILAWQLRPAASDTATSTASPVPARATRNTDAGLSANLIGTMLQRPLFSPDRRPAAASAGPAAAVSIEDLPRLTGIIISPAGAWAIFADESGQPRIAATGDSLGNFRVGTVSAGQISLFTAEGQRVLRPSFAKLPGASGVPIAAEARNAR